MRNGFALLLTVPVMPRCWDARGEKAGRHFVVQDVGGGKDVEEAVQVGFTHALIVRRQRIVHANTRHVASGVQEQRLHHRRSRQRQTLIDEVVPYEGRGSRCRGRRRARA